VTVILFLSVMLNNRQMMDAYVTVKRRNKTEHQSLCYSSLTLPPACDYLTALAIVNGLTRVVWDSNCGCDCELD